MQQRPQMIKAELQHSEAFSWVFVLMDQSFDMPAAANLLKSSFSKTEANPSGKTLDCQRTYEDDHVPAPEDTKHLS